MRSLGYLVLLVGLSLLQSCAGCRPPDEPVEPPCEGPLCLTPDGGSAGRDGDCDGIDDEREVGGALGCRLDPANVDTDGDGLSDGLETGATAPGPSAACAYTAATFDADPATTTNPCKADTDGDGVLDGVEDSNHNGRVDPGELDPTNPSDANGPPGEACAENKLRRIVVRESAVPDLRLALSTGFEPAAGGQLTVMTVGGVERGLMGYDAIAKVAFLAFTEPARGGSTTPSGDEAQLRGVLAAQGALSNSTSQTFPTWDGHFALQAFYDQAGSADLIAHANRLANALVGGGAGSLQGLAGRTGDFKLQAEYVHRSNQAVTVLIALTPKANYVEPALFTMSDTAGGSGLAAFPDTTDKQCETFSVKNGKVDLLFSVDDSASMPDEQQALADIAALVAQNLNGSSLDWRIAMVTTAYLGTPVGTGNRGVVRGFTRDINQFKAWLTKNSVCVSSQCTLVNPAAACDSNGAGPDGKNDGCWIGAGGTGNVPAEAILGAARKALDDLAPATVTEQVDRVRADAQVVVVLVGDADDQTTGYTTSDRTCVAGMTCEPVANFIRYFQATGTTPRVDKNPFGKRVAVHAIACPDGQQCNETQATPRRHFQVVSALGGVAGNIYSPASIQTAMGAILQSVIGAGGHRLQKPPIGASMKVSMGAVLDPGACNKADLPRSRIHGFDVDGVNRTLTLHGACRAPPATPAAVSYRAWIKKAPTGCTPVACGGTCPTGLRCHVATCECEPDIN